MPRKSARAKMAEDVRHSLREFFSRTLEGEFLIRFPGKPIESRYDIINMRLVTSPKDDKWHFEPEHLAYLAGFEAAWLCAGSVVEAVK